MDTNGTPKLNEALAKAQLTMRTAAKDALNPHFKSKYADLASIWEVWREVGPALGLAIIQTPVDSPQGTLCLETVLLHSSGEERRARLTFPVGQQTPQGYGSALTYARRYSLAALVGIAADEDDDGNAASRPAPMKPQSPSPKSHRMPIHDAETVEQLKAALETAPNHNALALAAARVAARPEHERAALRPAYEARAKALNGAKS